MKPYYIQLTSLTGKYFASMREIAKLLSCNFFAPSFLQYVCLDKIKSTCSWLGELSFLTFQTELKTFAFVYQIILRTTTRKVVKISGNKAKSAQNKYNEITHNHIPISHFYISCLKTYFST